MSYKPPPGSAKSHMASSTSRPEWDGAARKSKVMSSWREELQMFARYTPAFTLRQG